MKDAMESWAEDPVEFLGVPFVFALLTMLLVVGALQIVNPYYEPALRDLFSWAVNVWVASFLGTMGIGLLHNASISAARALMPPICGVVGVLFLWANAWSVATDSEISGGRIGVAFLGFGLVVLISTIATRGART